MMRRTGELRGHSTREQGRTGNERVGEQLSRWGVQRGDGARRERWQHRARRGVANAKEGNGIAKVGEVVKEEGGSVRASHAMVRGGAECRYRKNDAWRRGGGEEARPGQGERRAR